MLYPSINEIKKKADSRYTLVVMAAKRSRDLIDGKPRLTQAKVDKPVSIAANEIAEGLIGYHRDPSLEHEMDLEQEGAEVVYSTAIQREAVAPKEEA